MPRRRHFALMLALLAAAPSPAFAHAILLDSTPAAGKTLKPGETTLRLRFNSRIDAARSRLTLIPASAQPTILPLAIGPSEDILTAPATLSRGPHTLRWQVLTVDGHITRGEVRFTVTGPR